MEQYIKKSAIVAEINRIIEVNKEFQNTWRWKLSWFRRTLIGRIESLEGIRNYINAMETRELELEEGEYDCDDDNFWISFNSWIFSTSKVGQKVKIFFEKLS